MVTNSRLINDTEAAQYFVPDEERAEWYRLEIGWDNVTNDATVIGADGAFPGQITSFSSRVTGQTDLFSEAGAIKAVHFLKGNREGLQAYVSNLHPTDSTPYPQFTVGLQTQAIFSRVVTDVPFYTYESRATYNHAIASPQKNVTAIERAELNPGPPFDTRTWTQNAFPKGLPVESEPYNQIELHDQRHLKLFGRPSIAAHPELNPNFDFDGVDTGYGTLSVTSAYNLDYNSADGKAVYPFPIEQQTPCGLSILEDYGFSAGPVECVDFVRLGNFQTIPTTPQVVSVLVHWVRVSTARVRSIQMRDGRLLYAREENGGIVTRRGTFQANGDLKVETLNTAPSSTSPGLTLQSDGSPIRARRTISGEVVQEISKDCGVTWQ